MAVHVSDNVTWDVETDEPYVTVSQTVRLTPVRKGDAEAWFELYNSPDVVRNAYLRRKPYTMDTARSRVQQALVDQALVVAELKAGKRVLGDNPLTVIRSYPSGHLMGGIDVYPANDQPFPPQPNINDGPDVPEWAKQTWDIGYNILPQYSGKGNMKASVKALIEGYVIPIMRLTTLGAEVRHDHHASLAILRPLGFQEVFRFTQDTAKESGIEPFEAIKLCKILVTPESPGSPHILDDKQEEWIRRIGRRWNTPGMSVSIVDKNKTPQVLSYGRVNSQGTPFNKDSLFSIASCSKLFTTYALGLLIADDVILTSGKKLAWDTKIVDILDDWKLEDEYATRHIDLVDLLSMRWGLPGHDRILNCQSPTEVLRLLESIPSSAELRQVRQYSNLAYIIASEIVTRLSGTTFTDFVKSRILDKLGMEASTYHPGQDRVMGSVQDVGMRDAGRAYKRDHGAVSLDQDSSPSWTGKTRFYKWDLHQDFHNNAGAGGIWTTGPDMVKWLSEIISPTLLPPHILNTVFSPHSIPYSSIVNPETGLWTYGLGTYIHTYRSHKAYYHAGGLPGQYTYQLVLPDLGKAVMVFSNDDVYSAGVNKAVAYQVMDGLLGLEAGIGDWENRILGDWVASWAGADLEVETESAEAQEAEESSIERIIEGTYSHPSYPDIQISRLSITSPLRRDFQAFESRTTDLDIVRHTESKEVYIAKSESVFIDTLVFTPLKDNVFNWLATKMYPEMGSDGQETGDMVVPFVDGYGTCVLGEKDGVAGLGMSGDWWVSGGKRRREIGIESGARAEEVEVWYTKM